VGVRVNAGEDWRDGAVECFGYTQVRHNEGVLPGEDDEGEVLDTCRAGLELEELTGIVESPKPEIDKLGKRRRLQLHDATEVGRDQRLAEILQEGIGCQHGPASALRGAATGNFDGEVAIREYKQVNKDILAVAGGDRIVNWDKYFGMGYYGAVLSVIAGILILAYPNLVPYIVGLFLIAKGFLEATRYTKKQLKKMVTGA